MSVSILQAPVTGLSYFRASQKAPFPPETALLLYAKVAVDGIIDLGFERTGRFADVWFRNAGNGDNPT